MWEGKPLYGSQPDAKAREAARTGSGSEHIYFRRGKPGGVKGVFAQAKQRFAVRMARGQITFINQPAVPQYGNTGGLSRRIQAKDRQS